MMREAIVDSEKWMSPQKFNRVYAVYQVLPGPEATEIACYCGMLAGGRPGAVAAGMGFLLPGFLLTLLLAWLYTQFDLATNVVFQSSFAAVQVRAAVRAPRRRLTGVRAPRLSPTRRRRSLRSSRGPCTRSGTRR